MDGRRESTPSVAADGRPRAWRWSCEISALEALGQTTVGCRERVGCNNSVGGGARADDAEVASAAPSSGRRPAVVARVLQVNRSGLYRTPQRRPLGERRPLTDPVDRLIVEVARANRPTGCAWVAALTSRELGRQVNRKRAQRVMRQQRLLQRHRPLRRRRRPGFFRVERPDQLWHLEARGDCVGQLPRRRPADRRGGAGLAPGQARRAVRRGLAAAEAVGGRRHPLLGLRRAACTAGRADAACHRDDESEARDSSKHAPAGVGRQVLPAGLCVHRVGPASGGGGRAVFQVLTHALRGERAVFHLNHNIAP
jgi:hypothetical protein